MGIPSYFSYIIKNHSNIIRNWRFHREKKGTKFSSLYMDCNSIIYDCVRKIENSPNSAGLIEDAIIDAVIAQIEYYVELINPENVLYIAFDGVAPFAKMSQQRIRRYKTGYLASIDFAESADSTRVRKSEIGGVSNGVGQSTTAKWNTSAITPGTKFMNELSTRVRRAFVQSGRFFGVKQLIVSASDEPGEGEHKMFQYMRDHALQSETIAVYGLDADLIMLSLFHCFACENIYIFRESPAFGKAILNGQFDENELIFLDNRALSRAIFSEMGCTDFNDRGRIYDYIFMCFLLGNDFLPHFPSLNIRTHGNFTILETYQRVIGKFTDRRFIGSDSGDIQWKWVKLFVKELTKMERQSISEEYTSRSKLESRHYSTATKDDREMAFDNIPVIYRAEEHYINPSERGWESRYYRVAFHLSKSPSSEFVSGVCQNYLEGLEWVFKYYTEGCPHWRWRYQFHYPPLFVDLAEHIPDFSTSFIDERALGINKPFHPQTQLAYVIPEWNHSLLLPETRKAIAKLGISQYYEPLGDLRFQWMFCRYFWESHAILKDIPFAKLEELDGVLAK